jgi:mono/diheme cytochrome c family protein
MRRTLIHLPTFAPSAAFVAVAIVCSGCQQKMANQPSYQPLEPCEFFADGRSARPAIAGTVARGHLRTDTAIDTGRKSIQPRPSEAAAAISPPAAGEKKNPFDDDSDFVAAFPIPVDRQLIEHGRDRYLIYCVVCHDPLGTGRGKIVERGYTRPPSYHISRLQNAPVGRLFAVVTEGYGSMPSYAAQIPTEDRWAIVAYVRALQLSQHFPAGELSDDDRQKLSSANP